MATIDFDEETTQALEHHAKAAGLSVVDYVRSLVRTVPDVRLTLEDLEAELNQFSLEVPRLPSDFSREDIYFDHD